MQYKPYILSTSKEGTRSMISNRNVTVFCPACSEQYDLNTSGMITCWVENGPCPIIITPRYYCGCTCGFCGDMIPVDSDMAYSVRALHSYGYTVVPEYVDSAELKDEKATAVIRFERVNNLPTPLPHLWQVYGTLMYTVGNRAEAVKSLEEWVRKHHIDRDIEPFWENL